MGPTSGGSAADRRLADKSYVIVALPKQDDPVNSLSTEKKPHLTLLYLGPQLDNPKRVESFVRHAAANSLTDFYLTVKDRGPLGPDKADVLFFDKFGLKQVEDFRTHLRSSPEIEKAYLSTEQYPEWIPHLTLGYPETPYQSKKDEIFMPVVFDRLALWSGDSEGPEFPLRVDPSGMTHRSIDIGRDFLEHYGVKGMKWGVIRDKAAIGRDRVRQAVSKVDKKKLAVFGSALAAGAVAAGAIYMAKQSGKTHLLETLESPQNHAGDKFVKERQVEPSDIIYATRGKNRGFAFRRDGGMPDPFMEWSKNDDGNALGPDFRRYGDRNEKVVGTFLDPQGRTDRAGRVIPHTVILPEHMAQNVHNADDLFRTAWPLIKDDFDRFYES